MYREDELPKLSRNPMLYFVLPVFFIIGVIVIAKWTLDDREIKNYGVKAYAKVIDVYTVTGKTTATFAKVTYRCNGKACNSDYYFSTLDNNKHQYLIGDSAIILYSKLHPTVVKAIGTRRNGQDHLSP